MKITHNLIDKIHQDLVWWKKLNQDNQGQENQKKEQEGLQDENQNWEKKGLDHTKLDTHNKIKSHWRHVRSRFYFTSASPMYTLLNMIKFGLQEMNESSQ